MSGRWNDSSQLAPGSRARGGSRTIISSLSRQAKSTRKSGRGPTRRSVLTFKRNSVIILSIPVLGLTVLNCHELVDLILGFLGSTLTSPFWLFSYVVSSSWSSSFLNYSFLSLSRTKPPVPSWGRLRGKWYFSDPTCVNTFIWPQTGLKFGISLEFKSGNFFLEFSRHEATILLIALSVTTEKSKAILSPDHS